MLYDYLERGVLAGVLAGVGYGIYMTAVGNPLSEYVHGLEHADGTAHDHEGGVHGHDHAQGHEAADLVSEMEAAVVSVGSGVLWAILLGVVFAAAYYFLEPALPGREGAKAYVLAGAGFLTVSLTPWLVLPPATPGAEYLYGVPSRHAMYVGLMALGVVVSGAAILGYRTGSRRTQWLGLAAGIAPVLALVIALPIATPTVVSHPELPGDLVTAYQGLVALSQAAIWIVLAAGFDWLRRRTDDRPGATDARDDLLASP